MNLCELIQKEFKHDREFCLYPLRHHDGLTQACTISFPRGININLKFFSDKYDIQVWVGKDKINFQPGNIIKNCFFIKDFVKHLLRNNKEAAIIYIYSLYLESLRRARASAAYDASAAYASAAYYTAAAYAADAASAAAYAYASAAYDASAAYASAAYYTAAAYASAAAYDAADAAYDASAAAAYRHMKKAFKSIIKYRKKRFS